MKVQDLLVEARQAQWAYTEKRVKGALDKVTLALEGAESGAMTRLAKRYERLDKSAKLLKEKRDQLNIAVKEVGDRIFDAEDALATRIIDTISYTVMLTASEKAESKKPTARIDYESAYSELAKLVPELVEQTNAIRTKYTEMIPAKDTPVGLRVKAKVQEGLLTSIRVMWTKFMDSVKQWARSYDSKLDVIKAKFPVKGKKLTEAKVKAYKLTVPKGFTEAKADDFIENQEIVTVEYFDLKGDTMYVYPHFELLDPNYTGVQEKLQKALNRFIAK